MGGYHWICTGALGQGEDERGISLLLADRRPHCHAAVGDLDLRDTGLALVVTDDDPVPPLDLHLGHGVGHLVGTVAGEPVDTAPDGRRTAREDRGQACGR